MASLYYSTAACEALPLFRRKQFRLLGKGLAGKFEGSSAESVGQITTTEREREMDLSEKVFMSDTPLKKQRIAGLNRGSIKLSDDFDEPLPDEFWLGIE